MEVFYSHKAAGQLRKLSKSFQKHIIEKMRFYASQKDPLKFARRMVDYREGEYRFRIGDYRVVLM